MKPLSTVQAPKLKRLRHPIAGIGDDEGGMFLMGTTDPDGSLQDIRIIASSGMGWDHISASLAHRCPTWDEMERLKRLFFHDHETAMQLHVPTAKHINCHPYCLHLWRPLEFAIPLPPSILVGPPKGNAPKLDMVEYANALLRGVSR